MQPAHLLSLDGLIVDNFAGGGGASTGIEAAIGRSVDIAINHDPEAIAMHKANHPGTRHYCQDVWEVDPVEATGGKRVALAWFSPDCKHFSKAKGGKPREKKIRDLAWVVHRWVEALKPFDAHPVVIMLENVEEFRTWGPLLDDGKPCPDRKGQTFDSWVEQLRSHGYAVQWKELKACDFGAPTSRKRLFLIARRDGLPIVWPEPTHGPLRPEPWRTAADIIDWTDMGQSIFDRPRPPADNTCRRIAHGIVKFVLNNPRPFIVPVTNSKWAKDRAHSIDEPLRTITTAKGGEMALVMPTLIQTGYGERKGQAPRVPGLGKPLGTVVAGGAKHALVTAFMAQHNTMPRGGVHPGKAMDDPVPTITTRSTQTQLVMASLLEYGDDLHRDRGQAVSAFLIKYYGAHRHGQAVDRPLDAITAKARFGLITVNTEFGARYISDIGMRMLSVDELYRAQSFPENYIKRPTIDGRPLTKTSSIAKCGNSVPPVMPTALVRANLPDLCPSKRIAA